MGKKPHPWVSHSVGAAGILKSRGYAGPQDDFERQLLLTLRGPVVYILHLTYLFSTNSGLQYR